MAQLIGESNLMNELPRLLIASGFDPKIAGKFPSVSKGLVADVMFEVAVDSASADTTVLNSAAAITPSEATYAASAECRALHAKECPNCPWDGTTIFPNGGGK